MATTCLLLFARARELAGAKSVEVPTGTVHEVLAAAAGRYGDEFRQLCATATVVVDGEVVPHDQHRARSSGDELAVLPPVSGGAHDLDAEPARPLRAAVLTVSDRASRGEYADETGPAVEALLEHRLGAEIARRCTVADDHGAIAAQIARWCDEGSVDLVVTNGGTGLAPRDVTPEATRSVLDVEAPGIAELMRAAGLASTPMAALARQVAGRRGATIVVNVPGSRRGAIESLEAVLDVLDHAVQVARGPGRDGA